MGERVHGVLPGIHVRGFGSGGNQTLPMELHDNPHLSDLVAQFIRRTYGPSLPLSDEIGSDGAIHFGRGGPYDEHSNLALLFGDGTNGRECEATLVAKRFGVLDLPELQPLLEHVLPVDTRGEQKGILRLGRIVERFWDIFTESWQFVHWAELIIRASIFYERGITKEGAVDPAFIIGCIEEAWARAKRGFPYPVPPKIIAYLQSLGEDGAAASFDELKLFGLPYCAVILWRYFRLRAEKLNRFGILSVIDPREWLVAWLEDVLLGELVYQQRFFEAQPDADRAIYGDVTCRGKAARIAVVVSDQPRVHSVITERHPEVILTVVRRTSGHIQCFRRRTHQLVRIKDRMQFLAALIRAREQEKRGVPVSSWDELTAVHGPFGAEQWFYDARTGDVYCGTRTQSRVRASRLFNEEFCRFAVTALKDSWDELLKQFIISHGGTVWTPKVPTAEPAATVAE